jgi:IS5 family transposase
MAGKSSQLRVAKRPGKRPALPNMPHGLLLDPVETAKDHIRAKVEDLFRFIKQEFGFQKTRLLGMLKSYCKCNMLAVLTYLYLTCGYFLSTA